MLQVHELELEEFISEFLGKVVPVMAHNADGVSADQPVTALLACIERVVDKAMNQYCTRRNALVPANRLPRELFLHIASLLPYPAIQNANCVCRHWNGAMRGALRDCETVSVALLTGSGQWTSALDAILGGEQRRCQTLHLRWDCVSPECSTVIDPLKCALRYLTHLNLWIPSCIAWQGIFATPAPALQSLCVGGPLGPTTVLPENLFNGVAPQLDSVWLTNVSLPQEPGPALAGVTDFAFFSMNLILSSDITRVCAACPNLEYLSVTFAGDYACADMPPGFTPPQLRGLSLQGMLPNGIFLAIVLAQRSDFTLKLLEPEGFVAASALCRLSTIRDAHVFAVPYDSIVATAIFSGDEQCSTSIEHVPVLSLFELLVTGAARLGHLETLTISDPILVLALQAGLFSDIPSLHTLSVLFNVNANVPLRHLFTIGAEDPRIESSTLHTVRLASFAQYEVGYSPEYDIIDLSGELVARWLPASVAVLRLCGVRLDGLCEHIKCEVITEWEAVPRASEASMDAGWSDYFPMHDALCL